MNLINEAVHHVQYGPGTVLSHKEGRITILFSREVGEKVFLYPEAFEHYLRIDNSRIQGNVEKDLQLKNEQVAAEKTRLEQLRIEEVNRLAEVKLATKTKSRRKTTSPKKKI